MSNVTVASFRWLETLEKEFDKAYVDVELLLNYLFNDSETGDLLEETIAEIIDQTRDRIKLMSNAWAQLVHKSQTIFQVNCKLEAQIVNLRSDLVEARAFKQASEKELEKLMIELHSAQLQVQKIKSLSQRTHDFEEANFPENVSHLVVIFKAAVLLIHGESCYMALAISWKKLALATN